MYWILVPVLPYTGHIHGADSHIGGNCDFGLCLETISIYKIPLTIYSSKVPVRITEFEARWYLGKFTANALLFHTSLFTNTCEQNTLWSIY